MRVNQPFLRAGMVLAGALVLLLLTLPLTLPSSLRTRLGEAIGERFGGSVELDNLRVSVFPRLRVIADAVVVRHHGRTDVPPLITIKSVSAETGLWGLLGRPIRLRHVHLDGLEINIPPDDDDDDKAEGEEKESRDTSGDEADESPLIVDTLVSERAILRILRSDPGKRPREFNIERLSMQDTGDTVPWGFEATLTNPTPPGKIATHGTFGPWNADRPELTPLDAVYEFRDADLGHFDGIRGILHSTGQFSGPLERILAEGTTDVPDFAIADVGSPVHLKTSFRAVIDGTNGKPGCSRSRVLFSIRPCAPTGGVVERDGEDGRTVSLDIVMDKARIEDVLALATKSKTPAMTGAMKLRAKFELPPGHIDPEVKMRLSDGWFEIAEAHFPKGGVQAKVNELSEKARGAAADPQPAEEVASDFQGRFEMRNGQIHFSQIRFAVPGARVDLAGTYALEAETLDSRERSGWTSSCRN